MEFIKTIVFGLTEGLTAMLPLSSSAHAALVSEWTGWELGAAALLLMRAMALLAVCFGISKALKKSLPGSLKWMLLGSVPYVGAVLALRFLGFDYVFEGTSRTILPFGLLLTALLLLLSDGFIRNNALAGSHKKKLGAGSALTAGLIQAMAVFTGVSGPGAALTGGSAAGLSGKKAAETAYLLAIPAIVARIALDAVDLPEGAFALLRNGLPAALVGALIAFVTAFLAVRLTVAAAKKARLKYFSFYLAILAAVVLIHDYVVRLW